MGPAVRKLADRVKDSATGGTQKEAPKKKGEKILSALS
jgi:hypothetical protein